MYFHGYASHSQKGEKNASILRIYNQLMGSIFSKKDVFQNFPRKQVSSLRVTEQAVTATMSLTSM